MTTRIRFDCPYSKELITKRFTCKIISDCIFGIEYEEDFDVWIKNTDDK